MQLVKQCSFVVAFLSALSCRTEVTTPPPVPKENVQPKEADARPNPAPEKAGTPPPQERAAEPTSAADVIAYATAKPVLEKHCFRCHTSAGKKAKPKILKHLSFDEYPPTGHHAHEAGVIFRRVLLGNKARGKGPTMPSDDRGAVTGEDLDKILAWADAFDSARGDHAHHRAPKRATAP